jgi:hypothetical protein
LSQPFHHVPPSEWVAEPKGFRFLVIGMENCVENLAAGRLFGLRIPSRIVAAGENDEPEI